MKTLKEFSVKDYRNISIIDDNIPNGLTKMWNDICKNKKSIWEKIKIKNDCFIVEDIQGKEITLSSILKKYLPPPPERIPFLGNLLISLSTFANILATRPGKEEVTFYSLINQAHGKNFLQKLVDRIFLNIGTPPLAWRRIMVVEYIRKKTWEIIHSQLSNFVMLDIGCGAGFDGLDIHRILISLSEHYKNLPRYKIVNIDIDKRLMEFNEYISKELFNDNAPITRKELSIFDYIKTKEYKKDCKKFDNAIIVCNGFADFFDDNKLTILLQGLQKIIMHFPGKVYFIITFALKNKLQEKLSHKIGFTYIGRTKNEIYKKIKSNINYNNNNISIHTKESYSQIIFYIEKNCVK